MANQHDDTQPDASAPHEQATPAAGASGQLKAPLRRKWVTYVAIFFVACVGICVWAYLDATWIYPERGKKVADYTEYSYLGEVGRANNTLRNAGVADPKARFAELDANRPMPSDTVTFTQHAWLQALSRLNQLDPEYTTYASDTAARERYEALGKIWQTQTQPKPLAAYDIPSQWAILAVFIVLAGYNAFLFIRASLKSYYYDPKSHTLTLPGGATFTPEHIDEIDKRRWDKFKIALTLTGDHPTMGGQTVHFDTYRHDQLEEWILAMEEQAFGPEEDSDTPGDSDSDSDSNSDSDSDSETDRAAHA